MRWLDRWAIRRLGTWTWPSRECAAALPVGLVMAHELCAWTMEVDCVCRTEYEAWTVQVQGVLAMRPDWPVAVCTRPPLAYKRNIPLPKYIILLINKTVFHVLRLYIIIILAPRGTYCWSEKCNSQIIKHNTQTRRIFHAPSEAIEDLVSICVSELQSLESSKGRWTRKYVAARTVLTQECDNLDPAGDKTEKHRSMNKHKISNDSEWNLDHEEIG